jgi:hypothetical protein
MTGSFQSQMRQLPASQGGGYVLFSSVNVSPLRNNLPLLVMSRDFC